MLNSISSPITSFNSLIRHPIFLIAAAGIAVRFLIIPFMGVGYDSDFWATIIRNLDSGQGLYGLEGYYYTPVWGYVLSFESAFHELFSHIDVMGLRVPEAFPLESFTDWFFSSTVTSVAFNAWVKVPFVICDLIVGYLIYWLIKDKTNDMRKATIGFALWFLCPLVIGVTAISGMFDTFSVLFILLCIIMIRKDKLFLGGVLFSFAVLTKFFPFYFVFILIAYILVMHRGDGRALRSVGTAAAGAVIAFVVLMAPQIAEGQLAESLLFITARATAGDGIIGTEFVFNWAVAVYIAAAAVSAFLAYRLWKKGRDELDDSFFKYALVMTAFLFVYPPAPQYLVLLIPFLAIFIVTKDHMFKWSWLLVSAGGLCFILAGNYVLLMSLGAFTDLMSLDHIMEMVKSFQTPALMGFSPMSIMYYVGGAVQYLGILSVFWYFIKSRYIDGPDGLGVRISRSFSYKRSKV